MMLEFIPKVTAFITRPGPAGTEILLFRHPSAGIQIPAGTVEEGETLEQAVLREAAEETGLKNVRLVSRMGERDELPYRFTHVIASATKVYARPDRTSFDWAALRRGIGVRLLRQQDGFAQVTYDEWDHIPECNYISYQITGWVPEESLALACRRTFFHLALVGAAPDEWDQFSDNHRFHLFWAPWDALPEIVTPQAEWVALVKNQFKYLF
jgi:8-oxo-dGTP pyrophosphatase MutT (NUDIX family)